jgi:hypothetical protein
MESATPSYDIFKICSHIEYTIYQSFKRYANPYFSNLKFVTPPSREITNNYLYFMSALF